MSSREAAVQGTYLYPSVPILQAMPHLISHSGHSGLLGLHYQDDEILGAACCTQEEACLLYWTAHALPAFSARILEIGAYIGWSTAHLAYGGHRVTTIEAGREHGVIPHHLPDSVSPELLDRLRENLGHAAVTDRVRIVEGESPEAIPDEEYDLAFIDGWHQDGQPRRDVLRVAQLMAKDGVILLHDLWMPDVQDAACWLIVYGWHLEILNTANYLGYAWRTEPAWWPRIAKLASSPAFFHGGAERARVNRNIMALEELQVTRVI